MTLAHRTDQSVSGELGDAVRRPRTHRGALALRGLAAVAEDLARGGDDHVGLRHEVADGCQQRRGRAGDGRHRARRVLPGRGYERRRGQMEELVGERLRDNGTQRIGVEQVTLDERQRARY